MPLSDLIPLVESVLTSIAIVGGALWAYFHYFKGRTYRPRLELGIEGSIVEKESTTYVVVRPCVKNVGLSKVVIVQKGTGLRVSYWTAQRQLDRVNTRGILEAHSWVEPNESIADPQLIFLPRERNPIAVLAELRIVSADGIQWKASAILNHQEKGTSHEP